MFCVFFFKQKTAYEMRISDWSSDVCSSDLAAEAKYLRTGWSPLKQVGAPQRYATPLHCSSLKCGIAADQFFSLSTSRSEEHTSELQSLMRISYAVFCLKKKKKSQPHKHTTNNRHITKTNTPKIRPHN